MDYTLNHYLRFSCREAPFPTAANDCAEASMLSPRERVRPKASKLFMLAELSPEQLAEVKAAMTDAAANSEPERAVGARLQDA